MSHSLSFSSAEIETACFLIKFAIDHDMSEKIAVYLDDEFSAVYPLDSFAEWKYVHPLDHAALSALAGRKVIEFKFDDWMGL